MVQSIIDLGENEDRILNIVKAKYGLKNRSQAISTLAKIYEDSFLEPELRPEYLEKLERIRKEGYGEKFSSIAQLRKKIEKR
ncbi:DUF2683 family protein [Candidatus Pacearchaeota archaeon]|nr:DUF2683 family protein [Candidatus Pacearchaeota archaeon]